MGNENRAGIFGHAGSPISFFNKGPHTNQLGFWNYSLLVLYFLQNGIVGELTQMEVWNKKNL